MSDITNNKFQHNKYNSFNKTNFNKNYISKPNYYSSNNSNLNNDNKQKSLLNGDDLLTIKTYLLDYLYNKLEVNEHKYIMIKNISDIYDIKSKKYYISHNSCGINAFVIFMKKDSNYYSFLIDRRSISYNRQSLKKELVKITRIKLAVDLKFYDGTIIDGIWINENNIETSINTPMIFMVTDILQFGAKSLISMDYKKKMFYISQMFDSMIDKQKESNNIEFIISKPWELNKFSTMFKEYIVPNIKYYNIKGITFYPQYSGGKLIYIFDKFDDKFRNEIILDIKTKIPDKLDIKPFEETDKKKIFRFELENIESTNEILLNLEMKKTNINDVYKLYALFSYTQHNNIIFVKKRIGTAYIPTYNLSIKCKSYFTDKEKLVMSCKFSNNKNKWIPVEIADIQKIDIINNEKQLIIIEEEIENDEDNDVE